MPDHRDELIAALHQLTAFDSDQRSGLGVGLLAAYGLTSWLLEAPDVPARRAADVDDVLGPQGHSRARRATVITRRYCDSL